MRWRTSSGLAVIVFCLFLSGCALFERSASCAARKIIAPEILKIEKSEADSPGFCTYHQTLAALYAPYAIASLNAYAPRSAPAAKSCEDTTNKAQCPPGWSPDRETTSGQDVKKDANGLFMEAFHHTTTKLASVDTLEYVIAFRGTEPSDWQDWRANLRWVLPYFRRTDQYPEARTTAVAWVARACRLAKGKDLRVVTTGHSLGGGLAQGAAYAILRALPPAMEPDQVNPKSSPSKEEQQSQALLAEACGGLKNRVRVVSVVFDPSPVTGYGDGQNLVDCENPRSHRCRLPIVVRIYESGEILAYLRRFVSWFYPVSLNICEDRFNFGTGLPVDQHQMRRIASGLIRMSKETEDVGPTFRRHCKDAGSDGVLLCKTPIPPSCAAGSSNSGPATQPGPAGTAR